MKKSNQNTSEGILFTDQYQLTMAQLYYKMGIHEKQAQFDHFFRSYPDYGTHKAGFCINAGLEWLVKWMEDKKFTPEDISHLRSQKSVTGKPLFDPDFLNWLKTNGSFESITMSAIPEGRVVHPNVTLSIIQGPMIMAQILETALLNQLNYHILIATKAARIRLMIGSNLLLKFGARRAHDKGALAGVRAALIGGADFTSNVGISHTLGFPPKGTHSHSMVQLFLTLGMTELEAFQAFADVYPDDCILLVDTINTLESGIPNAIKVFEKLRKKGHKPIGIRLDSGDLAYLSIQAAKMLDDAGFNGVKIVLSNELDELNIWQIITQIKEESAKPGVDANNIIKRLVYGVGTRLITSAGYPALGGVYKLSAVYNEGKWIPAIKISESLEKTPNPGNKKVWRIYDQRSIASADLLSVDDENIPGMKKITMRHPNIYSKTRTFTSNDISKIEPLLVPILEQGRLVYNLPSIYEIRKVRQMDIEKLDSGVKRLLNPHIYHVSITQKLYEVKQKLIKSLSI